MLTVTKDADMGTEGVRLYLIVEKYSQDSKEYEILRKNLWIKVSQFGPRKNDKSFYLEAGNEIPSAEHEDLNVLRMLVVAAAFCAQSALSHECFITTRHADNMFTIDGEPRTVVCRIRDRKAYLELWSADELSAVEDSESTFYAIALKREKYEGGKKK
ncbi:MAG TPA: hypothetical protein VGE63_00155 [Candidatus Paceibacterota bacterium]